MKKLTISAILVLLVIFCFVSSCKKKEDKPILKVGFVSGMGSLHDKGFNQQAYDGLVAAAGDVKISYEAKECSTLSDIGTYIRYFATNDFDVIITIGYDAAQATLAAAQEFPAVKFIMLDNSFSSVPNNVVCTTYKIDQASFPCGFLAAYWAWYKNNSFPVAAYVAGPDIVTIQQFTQSYKKGIEYFNQKYNKTVNVVGANANSFNDTLLGAHLADSLLQKGAEVIFACAGKTGNGALYSVKAAGKAGIGVDTDQFYTIPDVGGYLITSCMKTLDLFVRSELNSIYNDEFHGGQTIESNLANQGVGLAPYHSFNLSLPDTIKQEVTAIETAIKNGTLSTGWPK